MTASHSKRPRRRWWRAQDDEPRSAQGIKHVFSRCMAGNCGMILDALAIAAVAKGMGHGIDYVTGIGRW